MSNETLEDYLEGLCRELKLSKDEKEKIDGSITAIRNKLISAFFDDGLEDVRVFGSFDRGTLLSRRVNAASDVDILVMFDKKRFETQTYLNKLKRFAEANYKRSDIYQDYPTIVIEMGHIRVELVPCIYSPETSAYYESFTIPEKDGDEVKWVKTKPNYYKDKINDDFPKTKEKLIKVILLFKYWNLLNDSLYSTYSAEKFVIEYYDYEEGLLFNILRLIYKLSNNTSNEVLNKAVREAKEHREKIKILLENNMEEYAIQELNVLLPEIG